MTDWKIVPREPTEAQMDACDFIYGDYDDHEDVYATAIAAAPRASQDEEFERKVVDCLLEADRSFKGYGPAEYWTYMARAVLKMLEGEE